ncbi:hypothetical protein CHARACLAT_002216 [Characodon lateralis]|uniref:Uncharacterized protein n=1 Tax=Characodon lateralis TaxID=208331 RepID=A0ABU7DPP6_9TELE|nr:hypothetical protein [Characodon lateralis]
MMEPQCSCFASLPSELEVFMNGQPLKRAPLRLMSVCSLLNTQLKAQGEKLAVVHVILLNYSNTVQLENTTYNQRFRIHYTRAHARLPPTQSSSQEDRCV